MNTRAFLKEQSGTVMFTVVIIIQIVLLIGLGFLAVVRSEYIIAAGQGLAFRALAAAEAGLEDAVHRLRYPDTPGRGISDWGHELDDRWNTTATYQTPGVENQFTVVHHLVDPTCNRETAECAVALDTSGNPLYLVTAEGRAGLARRTIQAVVNLEADRLAFAHGLCSLGDLVIAYSGDLAGYDSHDPSRSTNGGYDPEKAQPIAALAHGSLTIDWTTVRGAAAAGQDLTLGPQARILQAAHIGLDLNLLNRGRIAEDACGSPVGCRGATVRGDVIIGDGARIAGEVRYGGSWTAVTGGWQVGGLTHVVPAPPVPELPSCARPRLSQPEAPPSAGSLTVIGREVLEEGGYSFRTVEVDHDAVLVSAARCASTRGGSSWASGAAWSWRTLQRGRPPFMCTSTAAERPRTRPAAWSRTRARPGTSRGRTPLACSRL